MLANTLLSGLTSTGPAEGVAPHMYPFEKLVGRWRLEIIDFGRDGSSRKHSGTWTFGWGLAGRAILDVWDVPGREHGLTVRFYDRAIQAWRSTWMGPAHGVVMAFIGHYEHNEIVLRTSHQDGTLERWIFSDISAESFEWRGETSTDNGVHWHLDQVMHGRRIPAGEDDAPLGACVSHD